MKVLHLLSSGDIGGIEVLCKDIGLQSKNDNYFLFVWRGGIIEKEMRKSGLDTGIIGLNKVFSFKPLSNIIRYCTHNQIDIIIVHHPAPLLWFYIPFMRKRLKNIKILLYAHNHVDNMLGKSNLWKRKINKHLLSKAIKYSDLIIAISAAVERSLLNKFRVNTDRIKVIYNGIDIERFYVDKIEKNIIPQIVFVGRIKKEKGVHILIDALKLLADRGYNFECRLIGEGPYLEEARKKISHLGLTNYILAPGAKTNIPEILAQAEIFAHPSVWEEGFGISIAEALASGLICVGTTRGAIPELIIDGVNGFLVESEDINQLAEVLARIIDQLGDSSMVKIRENARKRAEKFSIEEMVQSLDELISNNLRVAKKCQ